MERGRLGLGRRRRFARLAFGGTGPAANIVRDNRIRGNAPADAIYDGGGSGHRLAGNDCATSIPPGICG